MPWPARACPRRGRCGVQGLGASVPYRSPQRSSSVGPHPSPLSRLPRLGACEPARVSVRGWRSPGTAQGTHLGGHGVARGPELQSDGQRGPEGGRRHGDEQRRADAAELPPALGLTPSRALSPLRSRACD